MSSRRTSWMCGCWFKPSLLWLKRISPLHLSLLALTCWRHDVQSIQSFLLDFQRDLQGVLGAHAVCGRSQALAKPSFSCVSSTMEGTDLVFIHKRPPRSETNRDLRHRRETTFDVSQPASADRQAEHRRSLDARSWLLQHRPKHLT